MKLKEWITAERGRASSLALHLGVSRGRISQMASDGVPKAYMRQVRDFTRGKVTLEEMLPPVERQVA
jgi:DNA-binding transcriptional regulator YdaS (Cro superfamily)